MLKILIYNTKALRNCEEGKTAPMPRFDKDISILGTMAKTESKSTPKATEGANENAALIAKILANPEAAALLKAFVKTI